MVVHYIQKYFDEVLIISAILTHVVVDMLIDISGLGKNNILNKTNLSKQTIYGIIELDEQIEL